MNMDLKNRLIGLVLAGGKSRRMGRDKGLISYHNEPQREYLYRQMRPLCDAVYLSVRPEQRTTIPSGFEYIVDQNRYKGPLNGLLSAHHAFPEAALLVVACDLPMVNREVLEYLIDRRDPMALATAFATRETGLPEPLAAIWEPDGLRAAEKHLQTAESSCPRKFLINTNTALVFPTDDLWVANANDPQQYKTLLSKMSEG